MRGLRIVSVALCLWAAFAVPGARADVETDQFHVAVAGATRHAREAIHYFENKNDDLGAIAVDEYAEAWKQLTARYRTAPPAYAKGDEYRRTIDQVEKLAAEARKLAQGGDFLFASNNLRSSLREILHLQLAAGQRLFAHCVDEISAAMFWLWKFRAPPPDAGNPDSVRSFKDALRSTTLRYRECAEAAPAEVRRSEEFRRLFDGALASLAKLEAVDIAHSDALVSILRELHSFDRLIWLRFG